MRHTNIYIYIVFYVSHHLSFTSFTSLMNDQKMFTNTEKVSREQPVDNFEHPELFTCEHQYQSTRRATTSDAPLLTWCGAQRANSLTTRTTQQHDRHGRHVRYERYDMNNINTSPNESETYKYIYTYIYISFFMFHITYRLHRLHHL